MRSPPILVVILITATLSPTATPLAHAGGLPVCNAKHKRPANPYGSVLSEGLKPALAAAPTAGGQTGAKTLGATLGGASGSVAPQKLSRADWRASFKPCGSDRA